MIGKRIIFYSICALCITASLILSSALALVVAESASAQTAEDPSPSAQEQRRALEAQLEELEKQELEYEKTLLEYKKQGNTLKSEIGTLNTKIAKLKLQIKTVTVNLAKVDQDISETQQKINRTENKIDTHLDALTKSIRTLNETDRENMLTLLLSQQQLSDFFGNVTDVLLVQQNIEISLEDIVKLRGELLEEKEELSANKEQIENLRLIQLSQQKQVEATQKEKTQVLNATKGKESEYQKLLTQTRETAAQIRSRIFELLGGGELTFERAYNYAKIAESATGVRAALILAILDRESLLGKNVGRCTYQTAMHPTRDVPYFLDLLGRLGIDPSSAAAQVSCPNQHGTYGGAMGPAQFIPSTWKLYESKIANVTGNNPPSPWNNTDAFVATGVFMKDLIESASCQSYGEANKNVLPKQTLVERCAAAKYYSGGNWYTYRLWYGQPVVDRANKFEEDIRILKNS